MSITDFLIARIAEDEWDARPFVNELGDSRAWIAAEVGGRVDSGPNPLGGDGEVATATTHMAAVHIARHDPARVLAECEAKRGVVDIHQMANADQGGGVGCMHCDWDREWGMPTTGGCDTLRYLALPYADHPDYDPAWSLTA